MLKIERTQQFKRDYRRESKGRHRLTLESALVSVLHSLVNNEPLPDKNRDHALTGEWKDFRDCHIKPDLILCNYKYLTMSNQGCRLVDKWIGNARSALSLGEYRGFSLFREIVLNPNHSQCLLNFA